MTSSSSSYVEAPKAPLWQRLKTALQVLLGRPVAFRLSFIEGQIRLRSHSKATIQSCYFHGSMPDGRAVIAVEYDWRSGLHYAAQPDMPDDLPSEEEWPR